MALNLQPVDASNEASIDAYHEVIAAARRTDLPDMPEVTRTQVEGQVRYPRPATAVHRFVAELDGRAVAILGIDLPMADNLHAAGVDLCVHPDQRRRGVGRELFGRAIGIAREKGRRLLIGNYCETLPGGPERDPGPAAFAATVGASPALPEVRRRLHLDTVETAGWQRLYDDALAAAKGYSLLWWRGSIPDEYLADVAYLEGRMNVDAPMGDLEFGPENYDADRMRAASEVHRLRGDTDYHCAALDEQTGRVVGWSALGFEVGEPTHAWQGTTIVDPDHRGHRLGLVLKLENLIRTRAVEPALRTVDTWNAAENSHMIAINEAVGFRAVDAWVSWQCAVPQA